VAQMRKSGRKVAMKNLQDYMNKGPLPPGGGT